MLSIIPTLKESGQVTSKPKPLSKILCLSLSNSLLKHKIVWIVLLPLYTYQIRSNEDEVHPTSKSQLCTNFNPNQLRTLWDNCCRIFCFFHLCDLEYMWRSLTLELKWEIWNCLSSAHVWSQISSNTWKHETVKFYRFIFICSFKL